MANININKVVTMGAQELEQVKGGGTTSSTTTSTYDLKTMKK